jgi:EAL domain-containing protein (putative c-di-GMP-specific phosphodiesterase class I)
LLRWTHHTRGPISPAQFIPVAEACGLILPIGAWVLREATKQARAWSEEGLPEITMAVNVSGLQFQSEDFLEGLFEILAETGLDPRFLELEVTESLLMKRPDHTVSVLHAVREKGIKVAVDDFGTGYSSLSYLTKLPLDTLKIDQSFVRQIGTTPNGINVLTAIIRIGESLNLKVVAEGVETVEELEFLQAQQCSDAQGYYFSRPVPPERFVRLFEATGHWMKPVPLSAT